MFGQVEKAEHQGDAVDHTQGDADVAAGADVVHGRVAGCLVGEAAIGKDIDWRIRLEEEHAPPVGAIGQGIVGIERVVPMLKGGQVEV